MRAIANVLSVLLHPLWMTTWAVAICFRLDPYMYHGYGMEARLMFLGMIFLMTALFPLVSALLMHRSGLVSRLSMPTRAERIPVYITSLIHQGMCWYLVHSITDHPVTQGILQGAFITLLITLLITLRWKISAHMAGIGGLIGAVLATLLVDDREATLLLCGLFVLAGALGSARLLTSDHTPAQIHAGALLGFTCVFVSATYGTVF